MTGLGSPCGACKFLRRKCVKGCIFAPYFCHEQGAEHFAAIHKVFGASNASKILMHLPVSDRCEAAVTMSYEAQARLCDPIYGCVAHIFSLQQQVVNLQAQLESLKAQATQGFYKALKQSYACRTIASQTLVALCKGVGIMTWMTFKNKRAHLRRRPAAAAAAAAAVFPFLHLGAGLGCSAQISPPIPAFPKQRSRLPSSPMSSRRDVRSHRAALFDGIEEGVIGSSAYSSQAHEHENDQALDSLQDRVSILKRLTGDIHEEVENHNRMLDQMGNDMDASRGFLSGTVDKFKMIFETKSSRRMVTMVASFIAEHLRIFVKLCCKHLCPFSAICWDLLGMLFVDSNVDGVTQPAANFKSRLSFRNLHETVKYEAGASLQVIILYSGPVLLLPIHNL
ncbi:hypothetical protein GUJ93_ZPchr0008g12038 [Zizania palustris]|uniref:t-SNARE coiled-coil homology domain-containing protein n=1 Tax=Zizania palustris TaxID=103762 RepID=A0A8J5VL24_ZIZPA|nr:hypothetical protein GUJ93_ZPchr0008g12038 [Zizania palustris]